jgi:hypothetical protein
VPLDLLHSWRAYLQGSRLQPVLSHKRRAAQSLVVLTKVIRGSCMHSCWVSLQLQMSRMISGGVLSMRLPIAQTLRTRSPVALKQCRSHHSRGFCPLLMVGLVHRLVSAHCGCKVACRAGSVDKLRVGEHAHSIPESQSQGRPVAYSEDTGFALKFRTAI